MTIPDITPLIKDVPVGHVYGSNTLDHLITAKSAAEDFNELLWLHEQFNNPCQWVISMDAIHGR